MTMEDLVETQERISRNFFNDLYEMIGNSPDRDTLRRLRRTILETSARAGEGHIPSAFSILEIVWTLYDRVMEDAFSPIKRLPGKKRLVETYDKFVLSKGHGCLALYTVLAEKGLFDERELALFCQPGALLQGHPSRDIPGVECSTGSLGHGLPMAVGMAYALQLVGNPARVFCLVGDTECEEGTIWESAHLAARFGLSNLTVIVDNNGTSPNGIDGEPFVTSLEAKYRAFGWATWEIDGHDCDQIERACKAESDSGQPTAIIARTVKGHGCPPLENNPAWHRRSPSAEELSHLLSALT